MQIKQERVCTKVIFFKKARYRIMTDRQKLEVIENIVAQACDLAPRSTESSNRYYEGIFIAICGVLLTEKTKNEI